MLSSKPCGFFITHTALRPAQCAYLYMQNSCLYLCIAWYIHIHVHDKCTLYVYVRAHMCRLCVLPLVVASCTVRAVTSAYARGTSTPWRRLELSRYGQYSATYIVRISTTSSDVSYMYLESTQRPQFNRAPASSQVVAWHSLFRACVACQS